MSDVYQRMERAEEQVLKLRRRLARSQEKTVDQIATAIKTVKLAHAELNKRDAMIVELLATIRKSNESNERIADHLSRIDSPAQEAGECSEK